MTDKAFEQGSFVQPDEARPAAQQADELFVHGLLGTFHDREGQRRRLSAALGSLSAPSRPARVAGRRLRRLVAAAAVVLVVIAGVLVLQTSGSGSAYAVVSASLDAAKGPSQRRYELRLALWPKNELPKDATGTLDRGPAGAFLSFNAPDGHLVRVGEGSAGEWAIRLDGEIEREHPRTAWPKWVEVGDDAMLADSVDHLLEGLLNEFVLASDGKQLLPGSAEGEQDVQAHSRDAGRRGARGGPSRMAWTCGLDSESNVLERLEMTWPKPPEGRGGPSGAGPGPGGDGPEGRRGGPDGERPPPKDLGVMGVGRIMGRMVVQVAGQTMDQMVGRMSLVMGRRIIQGGGR